MLGTLIKTSYELTNKIKLFIHRYLEDTKNIKIHKIRNILFNTWLTKAVYNELRYSARHLYNSV